MGPEVEFKDKCDSEICLETTWKGFESDFGPILDPILGGVLRSKSSSDGTRSRVQGSICFQDRFGNDLEPF